MKKFYIALILVSHSFFASAQFTVSVAATNNTVCMGRTSTLTATPAPIGYTATAITTNPAITQGIDVLAQSGALVSTPLSTGNLDDGRWDNIILPFTFRFYGNIFNSVNISTNGWIGLGSTNTTTTGFNVAIPNAVAPNNVIHAITSDLNFGGGASNNSILEYFQDGFPPNRRFIINYGDIKFISGTSTANVQVILYETSNVIEIHTSDCNNTSLFKTQGIENSNGTVATAAPGRNNQTNWNITTGSSSYRFTPDNIVYTWSPSATLNTSTGGTVIATPTVTTTYSINALNTVNSLQANNTITVNVDPASYVLAATAGGATICQNISVASAGTYYRDGSCQLIAKITPAGTSPLTNSVNTCIQLDTGANKKSSAILFAARKYDINPILNPGTATANIVLYYLQSEFNNFNLKATDSGHNKLPTGPSDASGKNNLRVYQYHGTGTNPLNYTGALEILSMATPGFAVTWNSTYAWWEVTVPVNGFSGFYLSASQLAPVPIKLEYFKGSQTENKNNLNWKVTCTSTEADFTIERSGDGIKYNAIGNIHADQMRCGQPFDFTDENTLKGKNFYRINMTDADGASRYSNTILLNQKSILSQTISLHPNIITMGNAVLNVNATELKDMQIRITDNTGKRIQVSTVKLLPGVNSFSINTSALAKGTYQLTASSMNAQETIQFIVQ
ncbi:MAG: hypothetical protein WKF35_05670 [Ferruginibacter sp.]